MCDPTAIIVSQIAGTLLSAAGAIQQGKAAKQQGQYQAAVANNNRIMAERAAADAIERGKIAQRNQQIKTRQLIGQQRAVLAANGVVVDQGSALDITTDTAGTGKLDELTIKSNAAREAVGFQQQGANFQSEADLALLRGSSASRDATFSAGGTLLSGATSVASKWYNFKLLGVYE